MIGVIYARYSEGPRQTDQSIEGQVAECREYAKKNDIDVVEVYADRHISGKSADNRFEFQRMIADAQTGRFEVVIVWKIDRFGRNRQDIAIAKYKLKKAGVRLLYAAESVPEGPEGIVLESVLEGIAEYYSAELRQKVVRGIRETAKKGRLVGSSVPIGYKLDADRHPIIDEKTAPYIREVFRMYASGISQKECREYLQSHGITGQRGGKIAAAVMYRLFRNERYLGIFDYRDIPIRTEALIDKETFEACADRFHKPTRNAAGKAKVDYLLSGKCYCWYCGTLMIGETGTGKSGRQYFYYKCGRAKRTHDCELRPIKKDTLEEAVIDATVEDMLTDETIAALTDEILRIQDEEEGEDPAALIRSRIDGNRQRQHNLVAAIEAAPESRALVTRLVELENEEHDLQTELARVELKKPRLTREVIEAWLNGFRRGDKDDPDFRHKLVDTFVAKVEVKNGAAAIYYNATDKKSGASPSVRIRAVEWGERIGIRTPRPFIFEGYAVLVIGLPTRSGAIARS